MARYFSEMNVGNKDTIVALCCSAEEKKKKNGDGYSVVTLSDGTQKIQAKDWNTIPENLGVASGDLVSVELEVTLFNGSNDYKINSISAYSGSDYSARDFIVMPEFDIDEMYSYVISVLEREAQKGSSIDYGEEDYNEPVANIALNLIKMNSDAFKKSSAAVGMHHNLYGGLLLHTYEMMKAAEGLIQAFPYLDTELLLSAIAIHDIGKVITYNTNDFGDSEINKFEVLSGHLAIGCSCIRQIAPKHKCPRERVRLLEHMVASHHGKQEWGAIAKPTTPEAFMVFAIDYIDSRLYMYRQAQKSANPGEFSSKQFGLDNTCVYRPGYMQEM